MDRDETPEIPAWSSPEPRWSHRWTQAVLWSPVRLYLWLTASHGRTVAVMLALFLWTTAGVVIWAALNQP